MMLNKSLLCGSILIACLGVSLNQCAEQPSAGDESPSTKFSHTVIANGTACTECHAKDRPAPPHVEDGDCGTCHNFSDTKSGWLPLKGTSSNSDPGTDPGTETFSHEPPPTSCISCHAKDRPAAPHVQSGDCVTCHTFPKWKP
jgi:hypothetical protein